MTKERDGEGRVVGGGVGVIDAMHSPLLHCYSQLPHSLTTHSHIHSRPLTPSTLIHSPPTESAWSRCG